MNPKRRILLGRTARIAALTGLFAGGFWRPLRAWAAAQRHTIAFAARDLAAALAASNITQPQESDDVLLNAPDAAENGALVAITAVSRIPGTTALTFFVDKNPFPLSAHFDFTNGALPEVSLYLKMAQTSVVRVVAHANGKFYSARKEVTVTLGGCS